MMKRFWAWLKRLFSRRKPVVVPAPEPESLAHPDIVWVPVPLVGEPVLEVIVPPPPVAMMERVEVPVPTSTVRRRRSRRTGFVRLRARGMI